MMLLQHPRNGGITLYRLGTYHCTRWGHIVTSSGGIRCNPHRGQSGRIRHGVTGAGCSEQAFGFRDAGEEQALESNMSGIFGSGVDGLIEAEEGGPKCGDGGLKIEKR